MKLPAGLARRYALTIWPGYEYLTLAGIAAVCFFYNLGGPPLFDLDEGAFGEATREMLERGDFLTTYLNGKLRFDKPIAIYWLQAASVRLFGLTEFALRLPSALAGALWLVVVYAFARPRFGVGPALGAAAMTGTTLAITMIARAATADAVFNLLVALTMFDAWRYTEQASRRVLYRCFLWIGLAVLTKGPVAIFIPFATSALYFGFSGQWRHWARSVFDPLGLLLCCAVFLPWYVLEYREQGMAFIDGFLLQHNVGRFSATMQGHGGTAFYYFPAILLVLLPWSGLFLRVLRRIAQLRVDPFDRFAWLWFGVVFVLFSWSNTQLPHYVLYGVSPLFLLLIKYRDLPGSRWLVFAPALLFFGALLALPWLLEVLPDQSANAYDRALLERAALEADGAFRLSLAASVVLVLVLLRYRSMVAWQGLIVIGLWQALIVAQVLLPFAGAVIQAPVKRAALAARELPQTVVMWGINTPSFSVYRNAVTPRRRPRAGEVVYTRIDRLARLHDPVIVYAYGGVVLARIETLKPAE